MTIKVLIDTNIIIKREDNKILSEKIQNVFNEINEMNYSIVMDSLSLKELNNDKKTEYEYFTSSKVNAYEKLEDFLNYSDVEKDADFCEKIKKPTNDHDRIDITLLYALYNNNVNFLITENKDLYKRAIDLNLTNRIFNIDEAEDYFRRKDTVLPVGYVKTTVDNIDINDNIFDILKEDYKDFDNWFKKIQSQKRECIFYEKENKIGAILIYKDEIEALELDNKIISPKKRAKIATMVVKDTGFKNGEALLKWVIDYSIDNKYEEIYLTHYIKDDDLLVPLIEEYGFKNVGSSNGENYFIKTVDRNIIKNEILKFKGDNSEIAKHFYPYFCDDETVQKYLVPIKKGYNFRLFSDQEQLQLENFTGAGSHEAQLNAIKKVYVSHSKTKLKKGDLILFYQTPKIGISRIGVVQSFKKIDNYIDLIQEIGKLSVYDEKELKEMVKNKSVSVILFTYMKKINEFSYEDMKKIGIDNSIQTTQRLSHEKYLKIKEACKK